MKQTIGLMLVVRNEIKKIKECLDFHVPYVNEIAICDQQSDDGTWEFLKEYFKDKKIKHHLIQDKQWGYCEPSKQKTADLLSTDWLLYLDPDERFPRAFLIAMHGIVENPSYNGYNLPRNNFFDIQVYDDNVPIDPKVLTIQHPKRDPQLRLTRKSVSFFPSYLHHRVRITGKAYDLPYPIEHRKTIVEQWEDNRRYKKINVHD